MKMLKTWPLWLVLSFTLVMSACTDDSAKKGQEGLNQPPGWVKVTISGDHDAAYEGWSGFQDIPGLENTWNISATDNKNFSLGMMVNSNKEKTYPNAWPMPETFQGSITLWGEEETVGSDPGREFVALRDTGELTITSFTEDIVKGTFQYEAVYPMDALALDTEPEGTIHVTGEFEAHRLRR